MPEVRDACVQTSQAETISPDDWMSSPSSFLASGHPDATAASHNSSDGRLGKSGARSQSRLRLSNDPK